MVSQSFTIGDKTKKDACIRFMLGALVIGVITIAVFVGIYAFKSVQESAYGCPNPELDPYGMSNWTAGSDTVAFGCFPGHDLEGHPDNRPIISNCVDKEWVPPPPACAAIPMRLDCPVVQGGLEGTITMWQESNSTPTLIYGLLNITGVDRTKPVLSESVPISRSTCTISTDMNITMPPVDSTPEKDLENNLIEIRFNSTQLQAYKKATVRINMIFVDNIHNMVASLVSVAQGDVTLVMKTTIPASEWQFTEGGSISSNGLIEGKVEAKTTESPTILTYDTESESADTMEPEAEPLPEAII